MLQDLSASVLFPSCLQHRSFGQWWILFFIFFSSSWLCSVLFFCACACSSTRLLFVAWLCRICISLRSKTCFWLFACELEVNISASGQNVFFFRVHGRSFMIWSRQCKSRNPDRVWSCTWLLLWFQPLLVFIYKRNKIAGIFSANGAKHRCRN